MKEFARRNARGLARLFEFEEFERLIRFPFGHAPTLRVAADDGKRLGAERKAAESCAPFHEVDLRGGCRGEDGPAGESRLGWWEMTESGLERSGEHAESCTSFLAKRLPRSEATRELVLENEGWREIFLYSVVFTIKILIFNRPGPRAVRGNFSLAHAQFSRTALLGA